MTDLHTASPTAMPPSLLAVAASFENERRAPLVARHVAYRLLATALGDPKAPRFEAPGRGAVLALAGAAEEVLRQEAEGLAVDLAPGELPPSELDLGALRTALDTVPRLELQDEYDRVFGLMMSKECPPYATEFLPQRFSVTRAHALADIAGYYRAFGVEPSRDHPERADHVTLQLEFLGWLAAKELVALERGDEEGEGRAETCRDARRTFLRDHVVAWVPAWCLLLRRKLGELSDAREVGTPARSLLGWGARSLVALVALERAALDIARPTSLATPESACEPDAFECDGCVGALAEVGGGDGAPGISSRGGG